MNVQFKFNMACDHWELLKSEDVFRAGDRLTVTCQTLRLPDQRVVDDYYRVKLASFSVIYALTENDEVIVLRQYKHGVGRVCITLPGGQLELGEEPEFSARRELLEETGYGGGKWKAAEPMVLHGNQRIATGHVYFVQNAQRIAEPASGDLEVSRVELMSRRRLRQAVMSGELPISSHVAAAGLADWFV
ncbi:NUDIX hydrolase [Roseibium sp.]|uniref:NUDIX hydrolase n=1 Tax=Roseibium sp. TaxID=1936156 RepID=UPI003A96A3A8